MILICKSQNTHIYLSTHLACLYWHICFFISLKKMKLKVKCVIILLTIFVCASYILYPCVKSQGKINSIVQRIKSVESYCLQDFQDKNESTFYSHISVLNRIQNCHQYFDVFPTTAYHKVYINWILILILENTNQKFFSYFTENFAWWW